VGDSAGSDADSLSRMGEGEGEGDSMMPKATTSPDAMNPRGKTSRQEKGGLRQCFIALTLTLSHPGEGTWHGTSVRFGLRGDSGKPLRPND
jgi:hypothetical protein